MKVAQSITELFILWGKNHVNSRDDASGKSIFATSTIGIKVTQAIPAPTKNKDQNIILPFFPGVGKAGGTVFFISVKKGKLS